MRAFIICLLSAISGTAAYAQTTGALGVPATTGSYDAFPLEGVGPRGTARHPDNPVLEHEKLLRAQELQKVYLRYQDADGGKISPYHLSVIQRRARDILSNSGRLIGARENGTLIQK